MSAFRLSSGFAVIGLLGLSCGGPREGSVAIVTGDETDVFSRSPAPVLLVTEKVALDGARTEISRAQLPVDTVSLGELPRSEIGAIAVTALDAGGNPLARGETLFVQWGALESSTLEVFVQRTGELARMPRGPAAIDATNATVLAGRYVLETSGTTALLYDLLALRTLATQPTLPRHASSIATVGTSALVVDEAGATVLDLSSGQTSPLEAPSGGRFDEIAGGAGVTTTDGTQFVVGGTRTSGGPTTRVLVIDPRGRATFASLTTPREGACATWIEGRGLVVIGGASTGAGAEVLAHDAPVATPLPFPPEPVRGCGAVALDTAHVAIAGGAGASGDTGSGVPVRVIDLTCSAACAPAAWPDVISLAHAQAAPLGPDAAFVLGDDASGTTHAYRASARGMREIPLRVPRRGARLVVTPTHALAVLGGGPGIEQYLE